MKNVGGEFKLSASNVFKMVFIPQIRLDNDVDQIHHPEFATAPEACETGITRKQELCQ